MALMALAMEPDVPWQLTAVGILSLPVLILLNGFFVAAEFALVAIRRTRIEEMLAHGVPVRRSSKKWPGGWIDPSRPRNWALPWPASP